MPICAFRESPAEYKLKDLGFTNIQTKVQEQICFKKLGQKKVQLMLAHGKIAATKGFKIINEDPDTLIFGKSFPKETLYLASTKNAISKADKKKLNDAFLAIKADGTYDNIYKTY